MRKPNLLSAFSQNLLAAGLLLLAQLPLRAQETELLARYDEHNSELEGHCTMLLQDRSGMLWISTWNGLCRFDGYEFLHVKPQAGDGCSMSTDRIRNIWLADNGDIFCLTDEGTYRMDINTYRFHDLTTDEEKREAAESRTDQPQRGHNSNGKIDYTDPQGLNWQIRDNALLLTSRIEHPAQPLPTELPAMVRTLARDHKGRVWVSTRQDATLRLLTEKGEPTGYLGRDGRVTREYRQFGSPVYCLTQTHDGTIWLGSKPDGLFRLTEQKDGQFRVEAIGGLDCKNVYDIAEDSDGRLWIATLDGGLAVIEHPEANVPVVINQLEGYPKDACRRVRFLHITPDNILLAATTEGLVVGKIERNTQKCRFRRHRREAGRPTSLSCNATMDIVQNERGSIYVSTETGGICEILSCDLLADTLSFAHINRQWGLPSDMILSMNLGPNGNLIATSNSQLMLIDLRWKTVKSFGMQFFHHPYNFSETQPMTLSDGKLALGTTEGLIFLQPSALQKSYYQPPLVLTGLQIHHPLPTGKEQRRLDIDRLDTLVLTPAERSLTIHFAALDYVAPHSIRYQFRLGSDTTATWTNLGHDHALTLPDLRPGTYRLWLRSTNADGQWSNNDRQLVIIAEPTFWETPWAVVLLVVLVLAVTGAILYTYYYIKRIERQRQETLTAYLALLEKSQKEPEGTARPIQTDDPFMQNLLDFVEQNIGNNDASVGQMAEACAVSRSVLQRKLKQMVGVSPADFLKEARLKHACQLLTTTTLSVGEVAYKCGFADPKYFSRCFKQSVGLSPSDYKNANT